MKNLFLKIKGLLGFCQCDKCWHRAVVNINKQRECIYFIKKVK
ncbi:hypothetical protein [Clostridium perfringens]|uniref:Uncharacterized protein n=1 Tax=Clostridium perfringens E str. JGS1987 TaxID=451755 RepID=B1BWC4_CLOPF|nr:hypothetical protein [Clostridium perfringens]EDT13976.1 hypothetical protein AC3_1818 [Clostridium perfringens E str. JGS1987]